MRRIAKLICLFQFIIGISQNSLDNNLDAFQIINFCSIEINFGTKNEYAITYSIINKMWKSILLVNCILLCVTSAPMIEQIMMANSLSLDLTAYRYWDCDPCNVTNKPTSFFYATDSQPRADAFLTTYQSYPNPYGGSAKVNFAVINFAYIIQNQTIAERDFLQTMEVPVTYCAGCGIQKALNDMTKNMNQCVRYYLNIIASKKILDVYLTGNGVGGSLAQAFFPILHQISDAQDYGLKLNMSVFSPLGVGNSQWTSYVLNTYGHTRVFYWQNDRVEALPICDDPFSCNQLRATGDIFYCSVYAGMCLSSRYQVKDNKGNLRINIEKLFDLKKVFENVKIRIMGQEDNVQKYRIYPYWCDVSWYTLKFMGVRYINPF